MKIREKLLAAVMIILWAVCMEGCGKQTDVIEPESKESDVSETTRMMDTIPRNSENPSEETTLESEPFLGGPIESDVYENQFSLLFKEEDITEFSGFSPSNGKSRVIKVDDSCPVDIIVYDTEGRAVASIIDGISHPDNKLLSYVSEGQKQVYLPVYHNYAVKFMATGDGTMNCAIIENRPSGGRNRIMLFDDVEIVDGQEYMAYLPRYSDEDLKAEEASNTEYMLFLDSTEIFPSEELVGEDANVWFNIEVEENDPAKGWAFFRGVVSNRYREYKTVEAIAFDGYKFAGWYEGDTLVSTEAEYTFCITRDIKLTAVFE